MKITVNKLEKEQHMEAVNEQGGKIRLDGKTQIGGLEGGLSPMQLLLAGIGGCSAIDIMNILEKQKQPLKDLQVQVNGNKQSAGTYSEFRTIHVKFIFTGDLDESKVERAIDLSLNKYCSVSKALEKGSEITSSYKIR